MPRPPAPRDAGAVSVLEATIVSVLMVSSVAFVVTVNVGPAPADGAGNLLQNSADDALAILYDQTVVGSSFGDNALSVALLECMQNDCTRLKTRMNELLPGGVFYSVHVSNGFAIYDVLEERDPAGETVVSRHLLEPAWSFSFLEPALTAVNPTQDPVVMYSLPVFNSNTVHPDGSLLRVSVTAERVGDNSSYKLRTSVGTRSPATEDADQTPAVSLFFIDAAENAVATRDLTGTTLTAGAPSGTPVPLKARLVETNGVEVPAGTQLTLHVPQGWTALASPALNPAWSILGNATDKTGSANGSAVTATLVNPVSLSQVDFAFNATYLGDANDHYPFKASLSRGAYATATMMATGDDHATIPPYEIPEVFVSAPRPMAPGAATTWTLGVLVPQTAASALDDTLVVRKIEIAEESGAPIFDTVDGLTGSGTWASEGDKLVWTGSALIDHDSPLDLSFRVVGADVAGEASESAAFVPSVDLGGWEGRLLGEVAPGLYRGVFLPADGDYEGYNSSTGSGLYTNHTASATSVFRTTALPGDVDYTVGYVLSMQDSVFGSQVTVANRTAPLGTTVPLDVDVQAILYRLGPLGYDPTVSLNVYPPWAGNEGVVIYNATLLSGSDLTAAGGLLNLIDLTGDDVPEPTTVGQIMHNVTVPENWLFGPYLVEVEVTWLEELSAVVDGNPLTSSLTRSARVYDYFMVTPPDSLAPPSPLYDVHLVTWFGDWG